MHDLDKLAELFLKFPSIGSRQARRFAYFISQADGTYVKELSEAMRRLSSRSKRCPRCAQLFFEDSELCPICSSAARGLSQLMIIEKDVDLEKIERTGLYNGRYFVLGGVLPLRAEKPDEQIRIPQLKRVLEDLLAEGLSEVILALNFTPESEHTLTYLKTNILEPLLKKTDVNVTTLGRGLSLGSEVEYADKETLKNAFENRKKE